MESSGFSAPKRRGAILWSLIRARRRVGNPFGCRRKMVRGLRSSLTTIMAPRAGRGGPKQKPKCLIANQAYDSDRLRARLRRSSELIAPHPANGVGQRHRTAAPPDAAQRIARPTAATSADARNATSGFRLRALLG